MPPPWDSLIPPRGKRSSRKDVQPPARSKARQTEFVMPCTSSRAQSSIASDPAERRAPAPSRMAAAGRAAALVPLNAPLPWTGKVGKPAPAASRGQAGLCLPSLNGMEARWGSPLGPNRPGPVAVLPASAGRSGLPGRPERPPGGRGRGATPLLPTPPFFASTDCGTCLCFFGCRRSCQVRRRNVRTRNILRELAGAKRQRREWSDTLHCTTAKK